jgi:hypothetical protein
MGLDEALPTPPSQTILLSGSLHSISSPYQVFRDGWDVEPDRGKSSVAHRQENHVAISQARINAASVANSS